MSQIKLCAHIKSDGTPCQAIPLHDSPYCYFHRNYYKAPHLPGQRGYKVPLLESHHAIQLATTDLYQSFVSGLIPLKEARFALQLLRLASKTITEIERNAQTSAEGKKPAGVPGPFPPLERAGSATERSKPKSSPTTESNPFVATKPPQPATSYQGDRYYDPYGCLAPMKEKELASK